MNVRSLFLIAAIGFATSCSAQQPDYRSQLVGRHGSEVSEMLTAFEPNLPVLCPTAADPNRWTAVEGQFYRLGRWVQPNGYPVAITIMEGPGPATVSVRPDGIWTFQAVVGLEWQAWRIRAQNVMTPEEIAQLKPGTGPAAVEVLLFVRGIPAIPNLPPILSFLDTGGTS